MKVCKIALVALIVINIGISHAQYDSKYDFNSDGVIGELDLLEFQDHWHDTLEPTATSTPSMTATPSPTPPIQLDEIIIDLPGLPKDATPLVMVRIPAGTFMMGSDYKLAQSHEQPVHEVTISKGFYIGKYEITQAQWVAVMGSNPSWFRSCGDDCPVDSVSWVHCKQFITALNELGLGEFNLPSEAQWEYSCRAGSTTRYYFGDSDCPGPCNLGDYAWYSSDISHHVGEKLPNAFGLYDMHGNVKEWVEDIYDHDYYSISPSVDPTGPETGFQRVMRGGSKNGGLLANRSSFREWYHQLGNDADRGLRIVRIID